ncbi:MAG: NADH-quinone oxidoreductase subunit E [Pikeienuella sp.]
MLRRLHTEQPDSFAFTPENLNWAEAQIAKYPEGRQASAVIPLLWRAQEQEGWVSKPIIETVAKMLGMASIRVFEVASFYFMFQLKPVGTVAHFQICGTTSCMICGAEDLIAVCKEKIAATPHTISPDGKFSWEEVECLGACSNAPMAQIGKDYYEDLTAARFAEIIDEFARGDVPTPGPQNGRYASEPLGGLTSLIIPDDKRMPENASKELARVLADTNARITDGRGVSEPKGGFGHMESGADAAEADAAPVAKTAPAASPAPAKAAGHWAAGVKADSGKASANRGQSELKPSAVLAEEETLRDGVGKWRYEGEAAEASSEAAPVAEAPAEDPAGEAVAEKQPETLSAARDGGADDLKRIKGVGPGLEKTLNDLGVYHFDQIAVWTAAEVEWVDARLKFKGRIIRDDWIGQAKAFAKGE